MYLSKFYLLYLNCHRKSIQSHKYKSIPTKYNLKILYYNSQGIYLIKWQIFGAYISAVSAYISDCESLDQAILPSNSFI